MPHQRKCGVKYRPRKFDPLSGMFTGQKGKNKGKPKFGGRKKRSKEWDDNNIIFQS